MEPVDAVAMELPDYHEVRPFSKSLFDFLKLTLRP